MPALPDPTDMLARVTENGEALSKMLANVDAEVSNRRLALTNAGWTA